MLLRFALVLLLAVGAAFSQSTAAKGPLKVLESNPRWFADPSGKAVVLAGSHTWQNLQDNGLIRRGGTSDPPLVFDYDAYLDLLSHHGHNFFRLWRWETPRWTDRFTGDEVKYATPHPWMRTGPGAAADGKPKFDLTKFNPEYFRRLRDRVETAGSKGIYVSVMLFEGWELQNSDAWLCHPYHRPNNVNDVEGDLNGDGKALEYTMLSDAGQGPRVLAFEEAYVRKVIETVNDLDNVLYEIANESHGDSTAWQFHMIRFVKATEAAMAKQHPVGMTYQYRGGTNATLDESPADWISPNPGSEKENYRNNPCGDCSSKVVVSDTDHLWGHTGGDAIWVWKTFARGLNILLMEEMLPSPTWQDSARVAMGQVRRMGERVHLAGMKPEPALGGTGYCLAERGREYLIFQHDKGEFTVNLKDAQGRYEAEWLNVYENRTLPAKTVEGGAPRTFTTPFPGPAVLRLTKVD